MGSLRVAKFGVVPSARRGIWQRYASVVRTEQPLLNLPSRLLCDSSQDSAIIVLHWPLCLHGIAPFQVLETTVPPKVVLSMPLTAPTLTPT